MACISKSVENATFIGWDHVFNVNESIFTAVDFKHLKGGLDQVSKVLSLPLAVVDLVSEVLVLDSEEVEDREDLSVVGHEGLADGVRAGHEGLQDLQSDGDDFWVSGVQGGYKEELHVI